MKNNETKPDITIRLGNISDVRELANLHYNCSLVQPDGFMSKMGRRFFAEYYCILLKEPLSVVVCADAGVDGIVGLASASLDARTHLQALRQGRYRLLLAALPALIRQPNLIRAVISRNESLDAPVTEGGFIVSSGARLAYWGWLPNYPAKNQSIRLLQTILRILGHLGACVVQLEVDRGNRKVEVTHRLLGARVVNEFTTSDGRKRIVMEYHLGTAA